MTASIPLDRISAGNTLGEGILWDAHRQRLWWTDIQEKRLHRFDWAKRTMRVFEAPERVGSFGFIVGSERLIVAFASGIAFHDPYTGAVDWIARPEAYVQGLRFNDGRVDRRGRFWCGSMVESPAGDVTGSLYSVDASGSVRCHVRGVRISNSLCTSPDGKHLYFADSATRTIWVYDLVEPEGTLAARRIFAQTPEGISPDGASVDA
ncbi:MAG: SMP-30/gluconolactonase/LRE family protein, partial [Steroidobacteraceae bacterium]